MADLDTRAQKRLAKAWLAENGPTS